MLEFERDISACLEILDNGGVILYPTDTIWGIGCDATNGEAVERIYGLKKRPNDKSMIVLVADETQLLDYVKDPGPDVFEYLKATGKPTTMIYHFAKGLADNLIAKDGTLAIRICKDRFCNELIKRFGKPLVSTSANISNHLTPKNFSQISEEIRSGVDYVVSYRQDDTSIAEPSALVRWENGKPVTLR